jgi:hypothetical protein
MGDEEIDAAKLAVRSSMVVLRYGKNSPRQISASAQLFEGFRRLSYLLLITLEKQRSVAKSEFYVPICMPRGSAAIQECSCQWNVCSTVDMSDNRFVSGSEDEEMKKPASTHGILRNYREVD